MSGLRERLGRLRGPAAVGGTPPPQPEAGGDWARLGAQLTTSPAGSFVMRRREYGADSAHGKYRLRELADVAPQLSCFHEQDAVVRLEELLFFDTETTGLGVGAGNVPFMVGIGYYEGELFIVEQLMIRNPAEEHAMLVYLQELLGRYTHIVSYNGRTFDWPILKNRFVLNRLQLDDSALRQIDLLYPSRSIWRNSLPSCRLSKVEESRLGFSRVDDVPGSMAPSLYFQYLAEKDPSVLEGVFVHNEHDIVTLAALTIHFGKLLEPDTDMLNALDYSAESDFISESSAVSVTVIDLAPDLASDPELDLVLDLAPDLAFDHAPNLAPGLANLDTEELFRTGLWLEKMARPAKAEKYFNELYKRLITEDPAIPSDQREIALLQLASYYKKCSRYERAIALWKQAIRLKPASISLQLEPYLELAMYYEHREKDWRLAMFYTEEAWARLWRRRALHRGDRKVNELEEAWEKRMGRLRDKLRKQEISLSESNSSRNSTAQASTRLTNQNLSGTTKRKPRITKPSYVSEGLI